MICTFYSYKGGVGRSMALANVAELMAGRGLKVLMVDFDLEAPGLERFFDTAKSETAPDAVVGHRGLIDLLVSYRDLRRLPVPPPEGPPSVRRAVTSSTEPLQKFIVPIYTGLPAGGSLHLLPAGRRDEAHFSRYAERVRSFDWDGLYTRLDGEVLFDSMYDELKSLADVVLVDSRTGISEMTGVCTFQLADVVVMLVAANFQNIEGTRVMARNLQRRELIERGRHGRELSLICVPSRVELGESGLLDRFKQEFLQALGEFTPSGLKFGADPFLDLKIPYVPYYAYAESAAVREAHRPVAADMAEAYTRIAASIVGLSPRRTRLYRRFHDLGAEQPDAPPPAGVSEHEFVGRDWVFRWLDERLRERCPTIAIVGGPGSGKSAIAAQLQAISAGTAPPPEETALEPGCIAFAHFCSVSDTRTADPRLFVESLIEALALRHPDFGRHLAAGSGIGGSIDIREDIRDWGRANAVHVERLSIGDTPPRKAFDDLIRRPLLALEERLRPDEQIVVLVDGLDESVGPAGGEDLIGLLGHAITGGRRPRMLRFVVTTSPHPEVMTVLPAPAVVFLNLDDQQSATHDDVRRWAERRLQARGVADAGPLAERVASASAGNFLYARLVVDELVERGPGEVDVPVLPRELNHQYASAVARAVGFDYEVWSTTHRRLLGVLAAARGGLTHRQLTGVLDRSPTAVADLIRHWAPYLSGPIPSGPLELFHTSFREFLLTDDRWGTEPGEAHAAIAQFFLDEYGEDWLGVDDQYALRHAAIHLAHAARLAANRGGRGHWSGLLTQLLLETDFLVAKLVRFGPEAVHEDLLAAADLAVPGARKLVLELAETVRRVGEDGEHTTIIGNVERDAASMEEPRLQFLI